MLGRGNEAQLIRQAEQGDFTQLRTLLHEHAANRRVMLGAFARIRNACTTDVRGVVYSRHLMRAVLCGNSGISKTTEAESCRGSASSKECFSASVSWWFVTTTCVHAWLGFGLI